MQEKNIFSVISDLIEKNRQFALAIITETHGSTPRKAGSKMIVFPDGEIFGTIGGGSLEKDIIEKAQQTMNDETPHSIKLELKADVGMECGGDVEVYIETFMNKPRLLIFGAGHIGQRLAPLGMSIGFQVIVIDERAEINSEERFSKEITRKVNHPLEFIRDFSFSSQDYIVIITHNHLHDRDILQEVIQRDITYIGMIGSTKKIRQIYDFLREQGIEESLIEQVHAPIGLNVRAETPAEISVLIAAELLQTRYATDKNR